jgi:hypothetical protein
MAPYIGRLREEPLEMPDCAGHRPFAECSGSRMDEQELVARVFTVLRDFPEDFDAPTPVVGIKIEEVLALPQAEKDALLMRLLEFARFHQRPRPIDEPIHYGTFLL